MKPAPFAYAKAHSLDHAIALLGESDDARLLAGGQSLIATLNMRLSAPGVLIDLNGLNDLAGISLADGHVHIGAMTRHADAEKSPIIAMHAPLIAKAMPYIGHAAIRNRGTLGGSIAFADPAAELPASLVALDGVLVIAGPRGERTVAAGDFFKGLFETALGPRDVLTAIRIPAASKNTRIGFAEFARRHGDYAMAGLAACAQNDSDQLRDIRLVYFGVGATPVRARSAETILASGVLSESRIDEAVKALHGDLDPADDVQATAAVKRHLAGVLLRRVVPQLKEAAT